MAVRQADVLLLAGDISDNVALICQSLITAAGTFGKVFFVPGNHELWVRGERHDGRYYRTNIIHVTVALQALQFHYVVLAQICATCSVH